MLNKKNIGKFLKKLKKSKFIFVTGVLAQFITIYLFIFPTPTSTNAIYNYNHTENKIYININFINKK